MNRRRFIMNVGAIALAGAPLARIRASQELTEIPAKAGDLGRWRVKAIGIGSAGGNIVNQTIASRFVGVDEYVYINTDAYALDHSAADRKIILGTGERQPAVAACRLALAASDRIATAIADADVLLLIAGMGGSAGTAIAPVIGKLARESGALTIALLTTPFAFEGRRKLVARRGVLVMQTVADWTMVRCNDAAIAAFPGGRFTRLRAYAMANDVIIDDARAVLAVVSSIDRDRYTTQVVA